MLADGIVVSLVCEIPNALKDLPPAFMKRLAFLNRCHNSDLKLIHTRVGMHPRIHEALLIEFAN